MTAKAKNLIQQYYDAFNKRDLDTFMSLLDEKVIHDINQADREIGKKLFQSFMERMNTCCKEQISSLVIMANEEGTLAAAEFIVDGEYLVSDAGLPKATGQKYRLPCGAFFGIKDNKITRVTCYYNMQDWLKQVKE